MIEKTYSPTEIAKICDVHYTTVYHWIEKDLICARRTPGGHHRIAETDLAIFLKKNSYPLPDFLRKRYSKKVLIVEDDLAQRRLLVRLIHDNFPGCELFEAVNGFEAGFMARDLAPILVVLDLLLPDVNGARICRIIRQNRDLQDTKILAATAFRVEKSKRVLLKAGADAFLEKPYKNQDFIAIVSRLLGCKVKSSKIT